MSGEFPSRLAVGIFPVHGEIGYESEEKERMMVGSNETNRRKQEKNSLIFAAAQAVHALLLILAVKVFAPVCTGMVDTAVGKQVPMRCHYTAVLLLFLGLILLVNAGLCAVRREMAVCGAITAVLSALAFAALSSSAGTGICLNPEMACHVTASFVKALGGIGILIGLLCTYMGVKAGK